MSLSRPTLTELVDRARSDLDARLVGADSRVRRSTLDVLARTHAGGLHGLYGYLDYIANQVLPDTADGEHLGRWASIWGVNRKSAVAAQGQVLLGGVNGTVVPAGAVLQRADGLEYEVQVNATVIGGTATPLVEALTAGAASLADEGVKLTLVSPIAGVVSEGLVGEGGLTGGADEEADEDLRVRLLERIREQPQGGSTDDYVRWAKEVAGVTRAWVYPGWTGVGRVGVAFVMDGREDIIPTVDDVAAVTAHIEPLRPVTARLVAFAPVAAPLALTINLTSGSAPTKAAIAAEVTDFLRREAEPGSTINISRLREAVATGAGGEDHELVTPAANVPNDPGEIAILGAITWTL